MTAWLRLLRQLLTAVCLELWTGCLRISSKVLHGYRRRKLERRTWEAMLATSGPACESRGLVWFRIRLTKRCPTRGRRTVVLVGVWVMLTFICFLNVWVVMTMLLVVGVPVLWLAWRFGLLLGYARVGRAYIRELEAGDSM